MFLTGRVYFFALSMPRAVGNRHCCLPCRCFTLVPTPICNYCPVHWFWVAQKRKPKSLETTRNGKDASSILWANGQMVRTMECIARSLFTPICPCSPFPSVLTTPLCVRFELQFWAPVHTTSGLCSHCLLPIARTDTVCPLVSFGSALLLWLLLHCHSAELGLLPLWLHRALKNSLGKVSVWCFIFSRT